MRVINLIFFLLATEAAFAQSHFEELDKYFQGFADNREINGNVLIADQGRTVYQRSFGYADLEKHRPNDRNSEFQLASISKTFTAVAILQLQEHGKLDIDDIYSKYFPDFPYPVVTIRQMLSHTSGLPDLEIFERLMVDRPEKVFTNRDIIGTMAAAKVPLKFQPGEKWSYCNLNFDLLALLVEKLTNVRFENYLERNIFRPSRMTHTYVKTALIHPENGRELAYNYDLPNLFSTHKVKVIDTFSNVLFRAEYHQQGFLGDANIYSTTNDLRKYDSALYSGRLLRFSTLELAYTPSKLNDGRDNIVNIGGMGDASYGLGWFIFKDTSSGRIVWHTGGMPGALTILLRNLTKRQMVVVLDNSHGEGIYRMGLSALNILNQKPSLPIRRSLARIYATKLLDQGFEAAAGFLNEKRADTANYTFSENEMNNLAYDLLAAGRRPSALLTFKLNILLFPTSDNAYESYGEALELTGNSQEAKKMYQKCLEINAKNEYAKKALEHLGEQ